MGKTWADLFEELAHAVLVREGDSTDLLLDFLGKVAVTLDLLTAEKEDLKNQVRTLRHWFDLKDKVHDQAEEADNN